ncbi:WYL domain-containing protein [Curvibacter sp. APW13]|uniref:helix-turn-helix transcriptional regulator n=1 Tax=Curvibacter sp. APW13 TaxID=3077236 RepID=UPI0028DD9778|nr:WYL domain-containing protein [Curvibacter sp. APW13]MDT8990714.1 WYL domain-containing protein [Curvibacter sp. APW13]
MSTTRKSKSKIEPTSFGRSSGHETLMMTLALLDMIPKVGKISTTQIKERLDALGYERDVRSIQRQMEALAENFAIEKDDSSKPYGYKWKSDAKGISIPGLTLQESLLLTMAEKYLSYLLPPSISKSMSSVFSQARYNLGPAADAKLEKRWLDKIRVVSPNMPLLPPEIKPDVMDAVSSALYFEHWLDVDYTNVKGERKQSRVIPLGLAQQGSRLFLICRFEGYDNERALALNRFRSAKDSQLKHPRVNDFDFARYDDDGRFGFGNGEKITLKFRIEKLSGQFLTESKISKDQQVQDLGDKLEFTATVVDSLQLEWWLRGFGKRVEVLAPKELVKRVQ